MVKKQIKRKNMKDYIESHQKCITQAYPSFYYYREVKSYYWDNSCISYELLYFEYHVCVGTWDFPCSSLKDSLLYQRI